MGYNSVIFICNDAMGEIDRDPEGWWKKTKHELMSGSCTRGWPKEYGFGSHVNGFYAVWNQHADMTGIIIVGQNMVEVVHNRYGSVGFHKAEGQAFLAKEWLIGLGYHALRVRRRL